MMIELEATRIAKDYSAPGGSRTSWLTEERQKYERHGLAGLEMGVPTWFGPRSVLLLTNPVLSSDVIRIGLQTSKAHFVMKECRVWNTRARSRTACLCSLASRRSGPERSCATVPFKLFGSIWGFTIIREP